MPITKIHNVETGEIQEREMSKDELVQYETLLESIKQQKTKEAVKQEKRQQILNRLGLTQEEADILLS